MKKLNSKRSQFSRTSLLAFVTALAIFSCSGDDNNKVSTLDNYSIELAAMYPEGVDYDSKNERFVIGSLNKGNVSTLSTDGKNLQTLVNDDKIVGTIGVFTDEKNNRLIVVSADAGVSEKSGANGSTAGKIAYVGIYNLTTGVLIKGVDLKSLTPDGGAFPNAITVDKDDNIYVTDSFSPVIYKIDKSYNASIFVTNADLFSPAPNSFGLNGIVYSEDGYLIAVKTDDNKLFKIMIDDPSQVTEVTGASEVKTPDGLGWTSDKKLVVIENGLGDGKVHVLATTDNWSTATQTKEVSIGKTEFPTTCALTSNGNVYVLVSYLGKILSGDKTQNTFALEKVATN